MPRPEDLEIERKFLVDDASFVRNLSEGRNLVQGYLPLSGPVSVRIRLVPATGTFLLTVKGPRQDDARMESECEITEDVATVLLTACEGHVVEKTRYPVLSPTDGRLWVIDVFHSRNSGLVIAELELNRPGEDFAVPDWAGADITNDDRYYNEYLASHPYLDW